MQKLKELYEASTISAPRDKQPYNKIGGEAEDEYMKEYEEAIKFGNFSGSFEDFVQQEEKNMRDEG